MTMQISSVMLLGRILMSAIFLLSGYEKLTHWDQTEQLMTDHGIMQTQYLLPAAVAVEIGGGACLLLGLFTRLTACVLLLFLIPSTLMFHNFWIYQGSQHQEMLVHFLKNITIMGGLLNVVGTGAGAFSLDAALMGRRAYLTPGPGSTAYTH